MLISKAQSYLSLNIGEPYRYEMGYVNNPNTMTAQIYIIYLNFVLPRETYFINNTMIKTKKQLYNFIQDRNILFGGIAILTPSESYYLLKYQSDPLQVPFIIQVSKELAKELITEQIAYASVMYSIDLFKLKEKEGQPGK